MDSEQRKQLVVIDYAFLGIVWVVVPLRLFVRRCIIHNVGKDDWLMAVLLTVAQILYSGYIINTQIDIVLGIGVHRAELTDWQWHNALKSWYAGELFYLVCTCLVKISFGYFLLRITTEPRIILLVNMIMMGTVIFTSIYFLMTVFQCHPVDAWWEDNPRSEGRCLPPDVVVNVTFFASAVNCLADFTFAFLPVLIVLPLSMSMTRKVLVVILMGMGAVSLWQTGNSRIVLTVVFTVEGSGSSVTIVRATKVRGLLDGEDFLYTNLDFATWSTVEVGTGMTATSLACLRPLFQNLRYMWGGGGQGPSSRWWQLRANRRRQRTGRDERNAAQDGAESGPWVWGNNDNSAINSASADSSGVRGRDARGNASGRHGGGESSWFQKLLQISVITTSSIATLTRRGREGQNEGMDNTSLAENGIATSAGIEEDARGVLDEHHEVQTLPRIYQQDSAVQIPAEDSGLYERAERRPSKPRSISSAPARASTREATSGHLPVMDPRALINVWQSSEVRGFVCVWMLTHDYYGVGAAVGADTHTRAITQWHQKQWLHY
ncbi:hypothetical protein MCOR27_000351 [Pyricularia oryzae]|uniref:Rhodopsin domain-containing protein n=2 Tax=Pyricularia TaxID=48558 RepID=A0ABQ8NSC0_PYRGI|nr:hypothetical protein MCOR02_010955 [Pyricularia oryzae]KAI6300876.1 hypothetical protein MCOR33_003502 [Pyricularia grisea]KAI6289315.1 hypothetical protein MCOR27_000351 [Pyricularia oryzae]KAI6376792.1 hypothetical protein MCOR31_001540 [Pyricularia oryzae]KAI6381946.1 hypothetical protein MCOR32_003270 [Pyricularia oryzae]